MKGLERALMLKWEQRLDGNSNGREGRSDWGSWPRSLGLFWLKLGAGRWTPHSEELLTNSQCFLNATSVDKTWERREQNRKDKASKNAASAGAWAPNPAEFREGCSSSQASAGRLSGQQGPWMADNVAKGTSLPWEHPLCCKWASRELPAGLLLWVQGCWGTAVLANLPCPGRDAALAGGGIQASR